MAQRDVCVLVLPSGELCATLLTATLLLGAVPLLVAPPVVQGLHSNLVSVLKRTVKRTKARLVICPESMAHLEQELKGSRVVASVPPRIRNEGVRLPIIEPSEEEVPLLQLTSGTTGYPRICAWTQDAVLSALEGMARAMRLSAEDVCFNWTPLYHDMGLVNNFLLCLIQGVPLVTLSPQDFIKKPALWLRGLHETRATVTWSPNFGFAIAARRVTDDQLAGVRLDGVRTFWNAAERIHLETMQAFYKRFACFGVRFEALKTNYGCAENVGGATFSDLDGLFRHERVERAPLEERGIARLIAGEESGARAVSVVGVGRPAPGIAVEIVSSKGRSLRDGFVGEIALRTPSRMAGYLGEARETRRALHGNLLRTGDLGYLRGGELFWVGRVRERIAVRGRKLDPSDFESVLFNVAGVRPGCFAAFGVADPERGTERVVIVTEIQLAQSRRPDAIIDDIRRQTLLELNVAVDDVVVVQPGTLTKTTSGKRRHRHFKKLYVEGRLRRVE